MSDCIRCVATPLPAVFRPLDRFGCEIPAYGGTNERQNGFIVARDNANLGQNSGSGPVDAVFTLVWKRHIELVLFKDDPLAERPVTNHDKRQGEKPVRKPAKSAQADVGIALRQAFQAAVNEDVPDELLDLLRRLD